MSLSDQSNTTVEPGDRVANILGSVGEVLSVWSNAAGELVAAVRWNDGTTDPVRLTNLRRLG